RGRLRSRALPFPALASSLPGTLAGRAAPRPLFGLAPGGVYHAAPVTGRAVRSYRTLSPLPVLRERSHRRSALCCTVRRLATPGRYPAPCPAELGLSSTPVPVNRPRAAILTRLPNLPNRSEMPRRGLEPPRRFRHQ